MTRSTLVKINGYVLLEYGNECGFLINWSKCGIMRNVFLSLAILFLGLSACQQSEDARIKQTVKKHIKEGKSKEASYKAIKFGEIDSVYLKLEETDRYQTLTDTSRLAGKIAGMRIRMKTAPPDEKEKDREELEKLKESIQKKREELRKFVNNYEPRLKGFHVPHKYKLGEEELKHTFEVDTNYQVVDTIKPKPEVD